MCGICGFTHADEDDISVLTAMCDAMAHRGPDGQGQVILDGMALGHRRLSLIDLAGGAQPMLYTAGGDRGGTAERGEYAIVFNGEIYNYRELRGELVSQGWEFSTDSDTEVLLVSYIAWGRDALLRLRGMFAFAIWDAARSELFCARDRFGIKPFYYTLQGDRFIFASEAKSILEHPSYERRVNEDVLEAYLCFQFLPMRETMFAGISKLPAAHYLIVDDDGIREDGRWWAPMWDADGRLDLAGFVDEVDAVMHDSVRYHNIADVEVGSFLSSGIDSSYMAALLGQINPEIRTFTVGFDEYEGDRDEISWARELADGLSLFNSSKHIGKDEYWDALEAIQWHMDEPSGDPSAAALYFVDQLAAKDVKAVLSGEGADELFAGYRIYQAPIMSGRLSWIPKPILRLLSRIASALGIRGANYLSRAAGSVADWYYTNANGAAFTKDEAAALLLSGGADRTPQDIVADAYAEAANADQVTQMQHTDMLFWLVGDILLKTDKMAMAHSLESRVPFLDPEVFKVASSIPAPMRLDSSETKIPLRMAAERAIPKEWARKEKLGFPVPIASWLREDGCYDRVRAAFESEAAGEFFDRDRLISLLDEHRAGKDLSRRIWIVYMFLLWHKVYFEDCVAA